MPVVQANNPPYTGVPTVEPSVETPSRYQTETATPAAFGGAVATATQGLGRDIGAAANTLAQTQDFINKVNADDLTNKYMEAISKIEFGDPNVSGDTGFTGKKGQNAISAFPNVRDQIDSIRTQLGSGLNPGARLLFDSETRRMQNYAMTRLGSHFKDEFNNHALEVSKAKVDNGLTGAANAIAQGDDAGAEANVGAAMRGALDGLKLKGLDKDPDVVNNALQKIRGEYVKVKAEHLALSDPSAAQTYLQNNSDAMNRDEFNVLMGRYRAGAAKVQALKDAGIMPEGRPGEQTTLYGDRSDSYGSPHSSGWGSFAPVAMQAMQKRGASTAFVQAAMAAGLAEGGFAQNWQKSWGSEESFGHWQLHRGGELDSYEQAHGNDHSTESQVAYLMEKIEERVPGITKTNDPAKALDAINTQFERYAGNALGQRRGYLAQARSHMGDMAADESGPTTARVAGAGGYTAFGDSIAAHLVRKAGVSGSESGAVGVYKPGDTAVSGWQPHDILRVIQQAPDSTIKGKDIILSTGAANVKGELSKQNVDEITNEIDTFLDRGAKSIRVLGVGNASFYSNHNDTLANIVSGYGAAGKPVAFAGPLRNLQPDGVHSSDPKGLFATAAATVPAAPPQTSGSPTSSVKLVSAEGPPDSATAPTTPLQLSRPIPPPDASDGFLPDNQVPGLAERLKQIDKNVPQGDVQRWFNAVQAARKYFNGQYQDQQRQLRLHTEQIKAQSEARMDQYIQRLDSGSPPTVQEIDQDQYLRPEHKRTMRTMVLNESKVDPLPAINSKNTTDLFARIHQQPGTEGKISDPEIIAQSFASKEINESSYKFLTNELKDRRDASGELINNRKKELLDSVKPSIYGPMASTPEGRDMDASMAIKEGRPSADQRYYNYLQFVNTKMDEYQKAGKNPHDLFDPTKPEFVGKSEILKEYAPPIAARLQQAPAAQPGFLGRIFGGVNPLEQMDQNALRGYAAQSPEAYDAAVKELQRRAAQGAK